MRGSGAAIAGLCLALSGSIPACQVAPAGLDTDQAPGTLESTASMGVARAAHTATSLPDGGVLIAGGFGRDERSAQEAELYDPAAGRWSRPAAMATPRQSHTATLLTNGKVLIVGGYDRSGTTLAGAELFDPATGTFKSTGRLGAARAGHIAVLLNSGKVLVAGGTGPGFSFLASAEIYDPSTEQFSPTGAMTLQRESHAAVRLQDGRVFVVGGHQGRGAGIVLHTSAEIYDPMTGAFARTGDMAVRRHKHDAVLLPDGRVLILGGADERDNEGTYRTTELFDPRTARFTASRAMNLSRYKHLGTSIPLPTGTVLIGGGAARAEIYDSASGSFAIVAGTARLGGQFSAAALLGNGQVLITGGYGSGQGPTASAWLYRP